MRSDDKTQNTRNPASGREPAKPARRTRTRSTARLGAADSQARSGWVEPSKFLSRSFYEVVMEGTKVGSMADKKLRFVRRILFLGRRWRNALDEALRSTGDNHARWMTLLWVDLGGGRANLRQLAEQISVELPTLVRLLNRLELEKLVVRRALGDSAREKTVVLTAKGKVALTRMSEVIDRTQAAFLDGVDPVQLDAALSVLDGVLARHADVIMWSGKME